jgi:isopentenyl diphosphate isomerase/L-lactate dehydrogenase-like FMN-dependent dehydrogenase
VNIDKRFPSVADMESAAAKRMPKFVHDYMVGGIGVESCVQRNRDDLNRVKLMPRYLSDAQEPDISTHLLGYTFDAPFGVAPLGLSGLMWPDLERILAAAACDHNLPYTLSTYGCVSLEQIKPIAGDNGWFQYYPSSTPEIEQDLLDRSKAAGYKTLVLTVDIPVETRRDRDIKNGLSVPPRFDLRNLWQMMMRPSWALNMLRVGVPQFETLRPYYPAGRTIPASVNFISKSMKGHITAKRFKTIRAAWDGDILVKGILDVQEAKTYIALGADGIVVSNHGGRQLDAAPSSAEMLPQIRAALGPDALILADGGIRNGLDIARMLALGANFVLLGRPFVYGVAAIGDKGGAHVMHVLKEELKMTMAQMGCPTLAQLPEHLMNE